LKTENQYIVAFKGLSEGRHDFIFTVGKPFIEDYEYLEARDAKLEVNVSMIKKYDQLAFSLAINGFIEVQCDRCLDFFPLEIAFTGDLYAKYAETGDESDGEVIILDPVEGKIDLSQYIFESICLSIPFRKVHPAGSNNEPACNRDMVEKLGEHLIHGGKENHPLEDKLKDLM